MSGFGFRIVLVRVDRKIELVNRSNGTKREFIGGWNAITNISSKSIQRLTKEVVNPIPIWVV